MRKLVLKARIGIYQPSINKECRNKLRKVIGEGLNIENEENYKLANLKLLFQFKSLLQQCKINGGYKKYFKFWIWVNHNFKYFPNKATPKLYFGGLPNFISSANLMSIENVKIFPNKYANNFRQKYTFFLVPHNDDNFNFEKLITFNIGGGQYFQHFLQDCLPVIAQTKKFLIDNSDIPILLPEPDIKFKNRDYLLEKLKITNKIIDSNLIPFLSVKKLYFWNFLPFNAQYCLPPNFYVTLRSELIGSPNLSESRTILLFTRKEKTRNFRNEPEIIAALKVISNQFDLNLKVVNTSKESIEFIVQAVKQARIIVGVHGGSMFNAIFCAPDCSVIEIIPTSNTNSTLHYLAYAGITYIPFPCKFDFYDFQVDIPIEALGKLIVQELFGD